MLALEHGISEEKLDILIHNLLYCGVFGIRTQETGTVYVYHLSYDMKRMAMLHEKFPDCIYVMHQVLRPALGIKQAS